jgi:hypothetical protein
VGFTNPTTTSVTLSLTTVTADTRAIYRLAVVTPNFGTDIPTGTISFPVGSTNLCTAVLSGGVAACVANGLRVSEATGASIQALGVERGHRTLVITRKGGKVVTIPLAPRTARAIDLAIGERCEGAIFLAADGRRLDRHGAARIVRRVARRAGIGKTVGPHTLRHAFITAVLDAGVPLRDVQEAASHADPRTTMRYDRARASLDGTPPTSWLPTSPGRPGNNWPPAGPANSAWHASASQAEPADLGQSDHRTASHSNYDHEPPICTGPAWCATSPTTAPNWPIWVPNRPLAAGLAMPGSGCPYA